MEKYYTYMYIREDGTPYYIGKGSGIRYKKPHHSVHVPPKERIIFLKTNLSEEDSLRHEIYMVSILGRKDNGTGILRNLTDGGEGRSGCYPTEETKKKISHALSGEGNPMYGKTHTQEVRDIISETHKGRKHTEEFCKYRSELYTGDKNPFFGKTHSDETNEKIIKRHYRTIRLRDPSGQIVEEYSTMRKFCRDHDLDRKTILRVLKGEREHHKGWTSV
jgi:group I intron endonuclease